MNECITLKFCPVPPACKHGLSREFGSRSETLPGRTLNVTMVVTMVLSPCKQDFLEH